MCDQQQSTVNVNQVACCHSQQQCLPEKMTHIVSLPSEIIMLILAHCDAAGHLSFVKTCKTFSQIPRPTSYTMRDLVQIETWPAYDFAGQRHENNKSPLADKDYFACRVCLRLRPAQYFSNLQMKGKRGKRSPNDTSQERTKRTCIGCAMVTGVYYRGLVIEYGGAKVGMRDEDLGGGIGLICLRCGYFDRVFNLQQLKSKLCVECEEDLRLRVAEDYCTLLLGD